MCEPQRTGGLIRSVIDGLANLRHTGLPWYRVLYLTIANYLRRARRRRMCCGNLGQPGC